jgi:hypothetical protein
MTQPVAISKINIQIGDQEIPLTLKQAKELQQILNTTFGQQTVKIEREIIREKEPWPWEPRPWRKWWW